MSFEVIPSIDVMWSRTYGIAQAAKELPCATFTVMEIDLIVGRFAESEEPCGHEKRPLARYNNALKFAKRLEELPLPGQPRYKAVLVSENEHASIYRFEVTA